MKTVRDPNKTKTGKTKYFGMTVEQLNNLITKTSRKKEQTKYKNRIRILQSHSEKNAG
jgi:hypothetical protein